MSTATIPAKYTVATNIDDAADFVNNAYDREDYDLYERLLEHYSKKFGKDVGQFEDDCTDIRLLGHGRA